MGTKKNRLLPILFNTEMVRAILNGQKTVTRRVIKPHPKSRLAYTCMGCGCGKWGYPSKDAHKYWDDPSYKLPGGMTKEEYQKKWTPPCQTGDILYVRETWGVYCRHWFEADRFEYRASFEPEKTQYGLTEPPKWRPSIHMPKEAARLFLRVKSVRVEQLQDITESQALFEGIEPVYLGDGEFAYAVAKPDGLCSSPKVAFSSLWDSTIKPAERTTYGWEVNPWVWVIEFERCEAPKEE